MQAPASIHQNSEPDLEPNWQRHGSGAVIVADRPVRAIVFQSSQIAFE